MDQLLLEIRDAVGSFVESCTGRDRSRDGGDPAGDGSVALAGRIPRTWSGASDPDGLAGHEIGPVDALVDATPDAALEATVRGYHIRAGRALLDWAMSDLARASGLSLSTVRRLEQDAEGVLTRNRWSAIRALRQAGIRFLPLGSGTVAVARIGDAAPLP